MKIHLIASLVPLFFPMLGMLPSSCPAIPPISPAGLEMLTIQEGGRKKPYLVFSEEIIRSLSGKTALALDGGTQDAMTLITGIWMDPLDSWKEKQMILVSNRPLKQQCGLDLSRKLFSYHELSANDALIGQISLAAENRRRDSHAKLSGLTKEASDVGLRLGLFESLIHGEMFRIIPPASGSEWIAAYPSMTVGNGEAFKFLGMMRSGWLEGKQQQFDLAGGHLIRLQQSLGDFPLTGNSDLKSCIKRRIPSAGPGSSTPQPVSSCFFPGLAGNAVVTNSRGCSPEAVFCFRQRGLPPVSSLRVDLRLPTCTSR